MNETKPSSVDTNIEDFLKERIRDCFNAIESGGSEFYPFDGHTIESLEGMKRAYGDILTECLKQSSTPVQEKPNKPDFDKLAEQYGIEAWWGPSTPDVVEDRKIASEDFKAGMEYIWKNYVEKQPKV